ncbi:MAG: hypothetical protein WCC60_14370 [Ilumatobacteraceae bacterium]
MATSSSARKVAKLASRGKGKKVRFSSGTTFPAIVVAAVVAMIALVAYAKVSLPGVETGAPQPTDAWSMAYGIKICDEWLPNLTGSAAELDKDASTGDLTAVASGTDRDGIIHYHAQAGGNTGRKAKLGVFLDVYDIKLTDTKLELPVSQAPEEPRSWNIKDDNVFKGTSCEGKDAVIKVRVWNDYTSGEFFDNVTDFRNLRFKNNGMVFAIAVVPNDADIAQPDSAAKLADLGVVGAGTADTTTTVTGDTTATSDTTATGDTAATSDTAVVTTTTGG